MFDLEVETISKWIGAVSAVIALIGGGYSLSEKLGLNQKPILEWAPQFFKISDAPADKEFKVVVAREKFRDDCSVEGFKIEIRDSEMVMHKATPSISVFSGPASDKISKFGYTFKINEPKTIAKGEATLMAHIEYKCPEGKVLINYPDHPNLSFQIK